MTRRQFKSGFVLFITFLYDLAAASVTVAAIVLRFRHSNVPAVVAVPVDARTTWGVALFAYLVSATPGSTCLHVSDDRRTLFVHFLHAPDTEKRATEMKALYERYILEMEGQ